MHDTFWVEEIRQHALLALEYAGVQDHAHLLAMLKAVESLHEASTALSEQTRAMLFPDGEEEALRAARNFYVHQYHRVDEAMARRTVLKHFPGLVERVEGWLGQ